MQRLVLPIVVPLAALAACEANAPQPQPAPPAQAPAEAEPAPEKPAMPPQARRNSPPEGMEVLAQGARTPAMSGLPATTGPWSRADAPTIVAFYRGHW
ncbi:MAG: hypothetical protein ACE37F_37330 [Nannocystaceae bacterium]|nr:hypothetical protein [bacterium]